MAVSPIGAAVRTPFDGDRAAALERVAFTEDPRLESWFERGRIGVEAARVLARVEGGRRVLRAAG